jgi:hypothetical protein
VHRRFSLLKRGGLKASSAPGLCKLQPSPEPLSSQRNHKARCAPVAALAEGCRVRTLRYAKFARPGGNEHPSIDTHPSRVLLPDEEA